MTTEIAVKITDGLQKINNFPTDQINTYSYQALVEQLEKDWWDYRRVQGEMCDNTKAFEQVNFTSPTGVALSFERFLSVFEKTVSSAPQNLLTLPIVKSFMPFTRVAVSAVDDCNQLCQVIEQMGVALPLLRCLDTKEFLSARDNENLDQGYGMYALNCCIFYANVMHRSPDVAELMNQHNGREILSKYSTSKSKLLALRALIAQSYLVADPKAEELPINDEILKFIIETVEAKFKRTAGGPGDFTLYGLLVYLHQLIRCSEPCGKGLLRLGFLDVMAKIMEAPAGSTSEASIPGEKRTCAKICWVLALHEGSGTENSKLMKAHPRLKTALEAIKQVRDDLAKAADGVLWQLNNCERPVSAAAESVTREQMVMISYTTSYKPELVKRINDELAKLGVTTRIFKNEMKGDIFDEITTTIAHSAGVVICYSNAYFNSEPCHAELNHARALGRTLIPVRLEKFIPRGWLGTSITGKLYYDFSSADQDENAFQISFGKLHDCIKSEFQKIRH